MIQEDRRLDTANAWLGRGLIAALVFLLAAVPFVIALRA